MYARSFGTHVLSRTALPEILSILKENARIDLKQLAIMVGVSQEVVEQLIKEMEKEKVILRFGK